MGRGTFVTLAVVAVMIVASCGGAAAPSPTPTLPATPTANPSAAAVGFASKTLAEGSIAALPTAPLYINFLDVPQPAGSPLMHAHVAGFVYTVAGVHQLAIVGATSAKDLQPGDAAFVPQDVVHTHANPGTSANQWYFIALRNIGGRTAAPTFPGQSVLYETPDLPALTSGKYNEQLNLVTLEKAGRTAAHRHGGIEALVVLEGTVQLRVAGQQPVTLAKGKGAYVLPNTVLQASNAGEPTARFLAFFVTADGAAFSTNVDSVP